MKVKKMLNLDEMLNRIRDLIDRQCQKKCGKEMTAECKKLHCKNYILLDNANFHREMGWIRCLSKRIELLEKEE